uniref:AI-2E family transporter n=1 Tax=uncultured Armatimonadetes bacterium TaxID=157466 RepID=A0A6J4IQ56_9BACT|nr:hypothetical protein AVDCRST_MAG63-2211 [uncultured Armatimonadetes bacterium]
MSRENIPTRTELPPAGDSTTTRLRVSVAGMPAAAAAAPEVGLSPATIEQAGRALFVLWLKIAATLVLAKLLIVVWPVLIQVILSLMLVAAFNPVVRRLQNRLSRGKAITAVVGASVAVITGLLVLMIPPLLGQGRRLLKELPGHLAKVEALARQYGFPVRLHDSRLDVSAGAAAGGGADAVALLAPVVAGMAAVLTVAVLTAYLLIDGPRVAAGLLALLPRERRLPVRQMFGEIGARVGDYVRGQLITSALAGASTYALLLVCGVPEALPLAFLMAVADVIPLVGPLIGMTPAVLLALTRGLPTALAVLGGLVVYHLIESYVLVPRIYGKTMRLAPSVIVIATLIGAALMGVLGALLALPAAAAVPVVWRYLQQLHGPDDEPDAAPALP